MPFKCEERKKEYQKKYFKKWRLKNGKILSKIKHKYLNSEKGFVNKCISSMFTPSKIKQRGFVPEQTLFVLFYSE
jgi:hypothetical protein